MGKEYYCRQKFLFIPETYSINIEDFSVSLENEVQHYSELPNLFDSTIIQRYITISDLDTNIDTLLDFTSLVKKISFVSELLLVDDRELIENPIYKQFSELTLKAYLWWFNKFGIQCKYISGVPYSASTARILSKSGG